jgi:hypothetical protein
VSVDLGPLKQTDYPMVKFWYQRDWAEFCATNQGEAIDSEAMRFVEDQYGIVVGKFSASMMYALAEAIFVEHGTSGAVMPPTWEQADQETKKGYYRAMAAGFFELRLCDSSWKAEQLAACIYSSWFVGWQAQIPIRPLAIEGKRVRNWLMAAGPPKKFRVMAPVSNTQLLLKLTHKGSQSGSGAGGSDGNFPESTLRRALTTRMRPNNSVTAR